MSEEDFLLEDDAKSIVPAQKKRAVVVVGRFQPPHCGHNMVIGKAKSEFKDGKYDAVVVVVVAGKKTGDNSSVNPLTAEERIKYLSYLKNSNGVKFLIANTAFEAFVKVREAGYEPVVVIGGKVGDEDRAKTYKDILDKHFNNDDGSKIHHQAISIERDLQSDSVSGVSGSIVRAAIAADRHDDFIDWVCMDNKTAEAMYKILRARLGGDSK